MAGMTFPVFNDYETYVEQEYGDVRNNMRVASHSGAILKRQDMRAEMFMESWRPLVDTETGSLPPSVTSDLWESYAPIEGNIFTSSVSESFDEIVKGIIVQKADTVFLRGDTIFWVMDLRRLFTDLKICVYVDNHIEAHRAADLGEFVNEVKAKTETLGRIHQRVVTKLKEYGC